MFEDKLKEIITGVYCGKVLVLSNYAARESLFAKGITPAIFLHHFYEKRYQQTRVFYVIKEKGSRDLCDLLPIDIDEYDCYKDERVNKLMRERVSAQFKHSKEITKNDLINKELSEAYLKSMHFYWFEEACKIFLYSMTLDEENHRISTLEQPLGLTFIIEIEPNTNIRSQFEKLRKESQIKLKKMFALNPLRIRNISIMVILFFNCQKKVSLSDARTSADILSKEFKMDLNLICCLEINSPNSKDIVQWSNYPRPILKIDYKLKPSDPIRLIGENEENNLNHYISNHREKIKQYIEDRLLYLSKRYEEFNTAKNKFLNFFKGSPQVDRSYNQQEVQSRQIADLLFILGDYKRCIDLYKGLAQKFEPNQRDQLIFYNICQMIQLSKALNSFTNNQSKVKVYESIQKYAVKFMLKKVNTIHKYKLHRYLIFLLYFLHGFRIFDKEFIKESFYYYIKKTVNEETLSTNPYPSMIPCLIHEQYANLNLLYPVPEYRRYCYDLIRVASKFNEFKLYQHHLRCLTIANYIYVDTFPLVERYVNLTLSKTFIELKNPREGLNKIKKTWKILINSNNENPSQNEQESQFLKLATNNSKIISQIDRLDSSQLLRQDDECIPIPRVCSVVIELQDESIGSAENQGTTWQQVGDIYLQKPELTSKGMNKQNLMKMLKMFDAVTPQDKELAFRTRNLVITPATNEALVKRNTRVAFMKEPFVLSFQMKNPLPNSIQISKIDIHFKNNLKANIKLAASEQSKEGKYYIKAAHTLDITFTIVPLQVGLYELSHISWMFSRMASIYRFKEPWETRSLQKSLYSKINVLEETGRLRVEVKHQHKHYEGQITEIQIVLTNEGTEVIDEIYLAIDNFDIFGFKMNKFDFSIAPGETKIQSLKIKIPLLSSKFQSNFWKCINKSIFLYKTGPSFRVARTVTIFNIYRIAEIYNVICERLSKNLHLLSFSIKYQNQKQQNLDILKSLIIDGGLQIKKIETNSFGLSIVQYFFFLRRTTELDLEQYKFTFHQLMCKDLIRKNYKPNQDSMQVSESSQSKEDKIKLYFMWHDREDNFGIIDMPPTKITATENTASRVKLPFNVKILLQDEVQNNFEENPFIELEIEFRIKNIFDLKDINLSVELIEAVSNDFYWQGITQHMFNLKYNEQRKFKLKLILFRSGVYNIARNIKYVISINKANSYVINHHEYENLYLIVKNKTLNANFDFFHQFENPTFKKANKSPEPTEAVDLL